MNTAATRERVRLRRSVETPRREAAGSATLDGLAAALLGWLPGRRSRGRACVGDHTNHTRAGGRAGDQSSFSGHIAAGQGPVANGVLLPVVSR